MSFGDEYIRTVMAAGEAGRQDRVTATIQKFGKLAAGGDQQAMDALYGADPGAAAQLESHFAQRDKAQAEWDDYVQDKAGTVAYSILAAPAERRRQELNNGIDYLQGLTARDPRLRPQIDRWRQLAAAGDDAAITQELQGVLDRSMSYAERIKAAQPKTPEERALATIYPGDPVAQAQALVQMKSQPSYINTPGGVIYRPGAFSPGGGAPARPQAAPTAAQPGGAQTMPFAAAAADGAQSLPGGAAFIPMEAPKKPMPGGLAKTINEYSANLRVTQNVASQFKTHIDRIDNGKLSLGAIGNAQAGAELSGYTPWNASENSRNYGHLRSFLTDIVNGQLRLNVGPQTDSDAKRTAQQILDRFGDTQFVRERLVQLQDLFSREAAAQEQDLLQLRQDTGYAAEPAQAQGAGPAPAAPDLPDEAASQVQGAPRVTERFAPLPGETERTRPQPWESTSQPWTHSNVPRRAPPPTMSYTAAKAGSPPPGALISGLDRARVEEYARRYGLSIRQAEQVLMEKQRKRSGRPEE